jgi:hypothetical protein
MPPEERRACWICGFVDVAGGAMTRVPAVTIAKQATQVAPVRRWGIERTVAAALSAANEPTDRNSIDVGDSQQSCDSDGQVPEYRDSQHRNCDVINPSHRLRNPRSSAIYFLPDSGTQW